MVAAAPSRPPPLPPALPRRLVAENIHTGPDDCCFRAAEGSRLRGRVAQGVSEDLCADGEEAPHHPSFSGRGSSTYEVPGTVSGTTDIGVPTDGLCSLRPFYWRRRGRTTAQTDRSHTDERESGWTDYSGTDGQVGGYTQTRHRGEMT